MDTTIKNVSLSAQHGFQYRRAMAPLGYGGKPSTFCLGKGQCYMEVTERIVECLAVFARNFVGYLHHGRCLLKLYPILKHLPVCLRQIARISA
jgi:hypothetical protein